MNIYKSNQGFTLIEIMITLTLTVIFLSLNSLFISQFYNIVRVNKTADSLSTNLSITRARAMAGRNNVNHGLFIDNITHKITLFEGDNFLSRHINMDQIYDYPSSVTISGIIEIVFLKNVGTPNIYGDMIVTASDNNRVYTITISSLGTNFITN